MLNLLEYTALTLTCAVLAISLTEMIQERLHRRRSSLAVEGVGTNSFMDSRVVLRTEQSGAFRSSETRPLSIRASRANKIKQNSAVIAQQAGDSRYAFRSEEHYYLPLEILPFSDRKYSLKTELVPAR